MCDNDGTIGCLRSSASSAFTCVRRHRRLVVTAIAVCAACVVWTLPLEPGNAKVSRCAAVITLVSLLWMLSPIPIYVTSLLPLILLPFMGILSATDAAQAYYNDTIMLFVGSFVMTAAMERHRLHQRIALMVMSRVGNRPRTFVLVIMLITAFMSWWISNTATCSLMVPLLLPILRDVVQPTGSSQPIEVTRESGEMAPSTSSTAAALGFGSTVVASSDVSSSPHPPYGTSPLRYVKRDGAPPSGGFEADQGVRHRIHRGTGEGHAGDTTDHVGIALEASDDPLLPTAYDDASPMHRDPHTPLYAVESALSLPCSGATDAERLAYVKALLLAVAASASLGGVCTLVGTGPNLLLTQQLGILFPNSPQLSFAKWMMFAVPLVVAVLVAYWAFLMFVWAPKSNTIVLQTPSAPSTPFTWGQGVICAVIGCCAVAWLLRTPLGSFGGWGALFGGTPGDGTVSLVGALVLFLVPDRGGNGGAAGTEAGRGAHPRDSAVALSRDGDGVALIGTDHSDGSDDDEDDIVLREGEEGDGDTDGVEGVGGRGKDSDAWNPILPIQVWNGLDWTIILLLGAGYAMAVGFTSSGLGVWFGRVLETFKDWPIGLLVFLITLLTMFCTELISNVASASILLPIVAVMAVAVGQNPLLLMIPLTIACSFAFMLPSATPPNALVYSAGYLSIPDMMKPGLLLNVACVVVVSGWVLLLAPFWGIEFGVVPDWAIVHNSTHVV